MLSEVHEAAEHDRLRTDEVRWNALAFVGIQDCFGLRGPDDVLELRNCTCGSTLARRAKRRPMTFEVYQESSGEYRWRMLSPNGQLTAKSEASYAHADDAHRAIGSMLLALNDVVIVDA